LELGHLPEQLVDPPGHLRVALEGLVLDLVDVVLQAGDDRRRPATTVLVSVDHLVEDGVQNCFRAEAEQVRWGLHPGRTCARLGPRRGVR
jgi:hypothetical protein